MRGTVLHYSDKTLNNLSLCCCLLLGKDHNFNKYNLRQIDYLNEVYDTSSLMHYGKTSFSSNGKPTIQVIGDPNKQLGQRNGFSNTDIAQLNALYDCSGNNGSLLVGINAEFDYLKTVLQAHSFYNFTFIPRSQRWMEFMVIVWSL